MISYKGIVRNMIEREVDHFIYEKTDVFGDITDIIMEKTDEGDKIHFNATAEVKYEEYEIGGVVDEDGHVFIGSVYYEGMRCTEKDEHGNWILESAKRYTRFIYGEALEAFTFER